MSDHVEDYWASRLRHPATRADFKAWEAEVEDFEGHVNDALRAANDYPRRSAR